MRQIYRLAILLLPTQSATAQDEVAVRQGLHCRRLRRAAGDVSRYRLEQQHDNAVWRRLQVLREPQSIVNRCMDVARGDGIANPIERIVTLQVAVDILRFILDQGAIIDLA